MRVIARSRLRSYWTQKKYSAAEEPLKAWYDEVSQAKWKNFNDLKANFPKASLVGNGRVVFNIHGGVFRLIMVQVENEVGVIPDARDHSPAANAARDGAVPQELIKNLSWGLYAQYIGWRVTSARSASSLRWKIEPRRPQRSQRSTWRLPAASLRKQREGTRQGAFHIICF
jgi:mRNA interferase HigB